MNRALTLAPWSLSTVCLIASASAHRPEQPADPDPPVGAFVWLLSKPRQLDDEQLARIAKTALGIKLKRGDEQSTSFVVGRPPTFIIQLENSIDGPREMATNIQNDKLWEAVGAHRA